MDMAGRFGLQSCLIQMTRGPQGWPILHCTYWAPLNTRMQMTMPQHHNAAEHLQTSKHTTAVYLHLSVCPSTSNVSTALAAGL